MVSLPPPPSNRLLPAPPSKKVSLPSPPKKLEPFWPSVRSSLAISRLSPLPPWTVSRPSPRPDRIHSVAEKHRVVAGALQRDLVVAMARGDAHLSGALDDQLRVLDRVDDEPERPAGGDGGAVGGEHGNARIHGDRRIVDGFDFGRRARGHVDVLRVQIVDHVGGDICTGHRRDQRVELRLRQMRRRRDEVDHVRAYKIGAENLADAVDVVEEGAVGAERMVKPGKRAAVGDEAPREKVVVGIVADDSACIVDGLQVVEKVGVRRIERRVTVAGDVVDESVGAEVAVGVGADHKTEIVQLRSVRPVRLWIGNELVVARIVCVRRKAHRGFAIAAAPETAENRDLPGFVDTEGPRRTALERHIGLAAVVQDKGQRAAQVGRVAGNLAEIVDVRQDCPCQSRGIDRFEFPVLIDEAVDVPGVSVCADDLPLIVEARRAGIGRQEAADCRERILNSHDRSPPVPGGGRLSWSSVD